MRVSLDPVRDLLERLGNPHQGPHVVHVAGSKGKGSLAALVAAGLWRTGRRVGTYASPHVERMNERVALDGVAVDDDTLAAALERALDVRGRASEEGSAGREATWFDTVTAAALLVFAEARVDWIVAECGLGGRLDSTNVLAGDVCAITSIELEHTSVLGHTRAAIAAEKAGILVPGCALVTPLGEDDEAGAVVAAHADELGVEVFRPTREPLSLAGHNARLARRVLDVIGRRVDGDVHGGRLDEAACERARLPGRMERRGRAGVPVVLDGAHTPSSVRAVLDDLEGDPGLSGRPVVVLGLAVEKDLPGILKTLCGGVDRVFCTSVGGPLHRAPEEIASEAAAAGLVAETAALPRVALDRALEVATGGGWVLALGSLYLAGELRPQLGPDTSSRCSRSSPTSSSPTPS
jgi:dihydrofolate synthase/folylpolyglutamate synthase